MNVLVPDYNYYEFHPVRLIFENMRPEAPTLYSVITPDLLYLSVFRLLKETGSSQSFPSLSDTDTPFGLCRITGKDVYF